MNPTSIHEDMGLISGLIQWLRICIAVICGVGHRCGLDPALLWLWCRPVATAPIQLLVQELAYAVGAALKRKKKKKPTSQPKYLLTGEWIKNILYIQWNISH